MSNVADYAGERAARVGQGAALLDEELAAGVSEEMAAALAVAPSIEPPALEEEVPAPSSPLLVQWLRYRDQFADAMEGGPHSIDALEDDVLSGRAYFWPGQKAAVVATVLTYPSGARDLQTLWAVGEADEVLALEPALASAARLIGCEGVLVEGRRAWEKLLKPLGYEPYSVTVRKVL